MKDYYVYYHHKDGEVVYVGKGKDARAWFPIRTQTSHTDWCLDNIHNGTFGDCVEILQGNLTQAEAYTLEREIIDEFTPRWNQTDTPECPHCDFTARSLAGLGSHIRSNHSGKFDTSPARYRQNL